MESASFVNTRHVIDISIGLHKIYSVSSDTIFYYTKVESMVTEFNDQEIKERL